MSCDHANTAKRIACSYLCPICLSDKLKSLADGFEIEISSLRSQLAEVKKVDEQLLVTIRELKDERTFLHSQLSKMGEENKRFKGTFENIKNLKQWSLDRLDGTMEQKDGGDYVLSEELDEVIAQALAKLAGSEKEPNAEKS